MNEWEKKLKDPPKSYRPLPFWAWNERLNTEESARQIEEMSIVSVIRDRVQSFTSTAYPQILAKLSGEGQKPGAYVQVQTLRANVAKHTLETPADVDGYLTALGSAIRAELEKGNRVLV